MPENEESVGRSESENKCYFCSPEARSNAYLEDDVFYVTYDAHPVSPGHSLVIPKRHVVDFKDISPREWQRIHPLVREVLMEIETADLTNIYEAMIIANLSDTSGDFLRAALNHQRINTRPDAYNFGINDGAAAGRTVNHFHWHIIPRYEGDMTDPTGGVRFVIPDKGNYRSSQ